ncbi:MAG: hypothetical protein ACI9AO_001377, partial [Ilumatobacter sp.]
MPAPHILVHPAERRRAVLGGFCATTATSICVENRCAQPRDPTWALLAFWDYWASVG